MTIEKGQIFGLLGPNGAGKTSLIRIINQITAPDSGEVRINGTKLQPSHIAQIGYMPEERGLYKKMEIGEQIVYLARLKGLSRADAVSKTVGWFKKLEIEGWWHKKIEELSKGMQQKAQFIATIIHEPELIILDEPFTGFDPVNAEIIKNEILNLHKQGATIIFSTHRMETVEELCNSIALLYKANKILDGEVTEIRNNHRTGTYLISYSSGTVPASLPCQILAHNITEAQQALTGNQLKVKLNNSSTINELIASLLPHISLTGLQEVIPNMNDIFIETVSKYEVK
ncbi:MAG: ATP-binding cassette domain-containing protein [Chitinophagia bacterium]|nr:ATP-binding cassette domain-containing protein [Chitinophagia bacterium]